MLRIEQVVLCLIQFIRFSALNNIGEKVHDACMCIVDLGHAGFVLCMTSCDTLFFIWPFLMFSSLSNGICNFVCLDVSQQQRPPQTASIITMTELLQYSTNGLSDDSFDESIIDIPSTYAIVRAPNLIFYIDIMPGKNASNDQTVYIDEDVFDEPSDESILEVYGKQCDAEIRRIIESHDTRWIQYHPEGSQTSNPLDIDDRAQFR